MTNEIIILDDKKQITPTELFTSQGINSILDEIKKKARDFEPDVTTEEGRKEIASRAYKVSRTKTALDNEGKKLTEEWARQKALVDSERKKVREELDSLRDEIRAPLNEYEEREEKRIQERKDRIEQMQGLGLQTGPSSYYQDELIRLSKLIDFDWLEFSHKANTINDEVKARLEESYNRALKMEREQEELEKLRKEKEEHERKEREDQIAKEAAEKARLEAERLAKEREAKIESDRKAAEQAKIDAERRAKEAEERAKVAAKEAAERERKRIEDERKAAEAIIAKREANKRHRAKIEKEIIEAIISNINGAFSEEAIETAKKCEKTPEFGVANIILQCIRGGRIPHVTINY